MAFETLHSMNIHKSSMHGYMAIKLDMSKAYDRVEWTFLESTMRKLGFNERWMTLIMICVKTVSYSVLVNGEPKESVSIHKGNPSRRPLFSLSLFIVHGGPS